MPGHLSDSLKPGGEGVRPGGEEHSSLTGALVGGDPEAVLAAKAAEAAAERDAQAAAEAAAAEAKAAEAAAAFPPGSPGPGAVIDRTLSDGVDVTER